MSPLEVVLDVASAVCLLLGCALAVSAGLALVRVPDLLSRLHASTKPQVLGLVLVLLGAALQAREASTVVLLALVAVFQLVTAPVAAHLLSRSSYRAGLVDTSALLQDDLAPQLGRGEPVAPPVADPGDAATPPAR